MKVSILTFVVLLLIGTVVNNSTAAQGIFVSPSQLFLTIPAGFIDVRYITISNNSQNDMAFSCKFDSSWIFVQPRKLSLSAGETRKILAIFFISRGENPQRNGTIFLQKKDGYILDKIQVHVAAPKPPPPPPNNASLVSTPEPKTEPPLPPARDELAGLKADLKKALQDEMATKRVELISTQNQLMVRIIGPIIFDLGKDFPTKQGLKIIREVGEVLKKHLTPELEVIIQGHADDLPIKETYRYKIPSNWELSSMRAATVARILHQQIGIQGTLIASVGFSYFKPLTKGETLEEKALNRRLEILIKPTEEGVIP